MKVKVTSPDHSNRHAKLLVADAVNNFPLSYVRATSSDAMKSKVISGSSIRPSLVNMHLLHIMIIKYCLRLALGPRNICE
ncbi:hypothetical protein PsorP6_011414 [Peronosclerospora sorghi]|uniref:Uncharacterized protein n=1 Tax=Peronosclerospora sorghi TaxID=230839 RepID=A0ACC0WJS2_9STRA|nr:hypothetical protein PsorP6_011414 [Peronosclerospora sorghi]